MQKTIKLDFEKLEVGTIVWDCRQREWRTITGIENKQENMVEFYIGNEFFSYSLNRWEVEHKPKYMRLTAMRVALKVEDIKTKEFVRGETNYEISRFECNRWFHTMYTSTVTLGTKYYTEENAVMVCEILNEGME